MLGAGALAGASAGWLVLVLLELLEPGATGEPALWRDRDAIFYALIAGAVLGAVVGPVVARVWLRRVPLRVAAVGVAAGVLAGLAAGVLVHPAVPYAALGGPVIGAGVAVAALRRRYRPRPPELAVGPPAA